MFIAIPQFLVCRSVIDHPFYVGSQQVYLEFTTLGTRKYKRTMAPSLRTLRVVLAREDDLDWAHWPIPIAVIFQ